MEKRGSLLVISGFSGVGKGTVAKKLVEKYGYSLSISATTRQPREGEVDGREYFFKTVDDFKNLIDYNGFIEYARYVDNYYGTPKDYVRQQLDAGRDVILEIEIQGARKIREQYPDTLMLFVVTPDAATLKERLTGRGTESTEVIRDRLRRASEEAEGIGEYDYLVVNDDLDTCVAKVHALIESEHCRVFRNTDYIKEMQKDMKSFCSH